MRLCILFFSTLSAVFSYQCYDGIVGWGREVNESGLKLVNCTERCCRVGWALPGTMYSCGSECPPGWQYERDEKCVKTEMDYSYCFCDGIAARCRPKF
ncbi:hypothetical protein PFISCL1PPCAC_14597 [Pristionchus fissidentatus]|uniref:TIL domain-containing protein n=1 Tax=Pristionchus fissidentatus TaxID=1538716 RepID=A0AAV5VUV7_9BILA|nr:hypothetical protein PFISCL1PPCAC_14597 [Pristionchus fissidentatus]